jgi:hypothetical protein
MNNNHFSLMRYLRDLGADAHLLLYSTDGTGANKHFTPENDTYSFERWKPYVVHTGVPNGGFSNLLTATLRLKEFSRELATYDFVIGHGFAPAHCYLLGRRLNLFLPYSYEVEFVRDVTNQSAIRNATYGVQRWLQINGLRRNTDRIGTIDFTPGNIKYLERYGLWTNYSPLEFPWFTGKNLMAVMSHVWRAVIWRKCGNTSL